MTTTDHASGAPEEPILALHPDQIDEAFAPTPGSYVVSKRLDDDVLVVDGRDGRIHLLNTTAAMLWECLDGDVTLGELAGELAEAFHAPVEEVNADVLSVARELGRRGLLEDVALPLFGMLEMPAQLAPGEHLEPFEVVTADGSPSPLHVRARPVHCS